MIRKIASLAVLLCILALALSCVAKQPATIPAPQATVAPVTSSVFSVARWKIENQFPRGMRLIVDVDHTFHIDLAASRFEMKIGRNTVWQIAPEIDPDNPNSDQVVFMMEESGSFNPWTEIESGTVTIKDKQVFSLSLFLYRL